MKTITNSQQEQLDIYSGAYGGVLFSVTSHNMAGDGTLIINLKDCTGSDRGSVAVSRRGAVSTFN